MFWQNHSEAVAFSPKRTSSSKLFLNPIRSKPAKQAFLITSSYDNESSGKALGANFHDMTIRHCTVYGVVMNTICLENDRHFPAYNLHFEDITFAQVGRGVNTMGWEALVNVKDSRFKKIRFSYTDKAKEKKRDKAWANVVHCQNVTID